MSLVTDEGLKKLPTKEALQLAENEGMDLVLVGNSPENPVCRILDYDKMLYEQKKKAHQSAKKHTQTKEIRMSNHIADNDIKIKVDAITRILSEGDKVKVSVQFKGREARLINHDILKKIVDRLHSDGVQFCSGKTPVYFFEGNRAVMVLDPA